MPKRTRVHRFPRASCTAEALALRTEVMDDGCWLWRGVIGPTGYGFLTQYDNGVVSHNAHRWTWMTFVGPIPEGMELDHLCRVRNCVNPDHLEVVTRAENMARVSAATGEATHNGAKTHCKRGHEYDEANTYLLGGRRYCRACQRINRRKHYELTGA